MNSENSVKNELLEDFREINFLYSDFSEKLIKFSADVNKARKYINSDSFNLISAHLNNLRKVLKERQSEVKLLDFALTDIEEIRAKKLEHQNLIRTIAGLAGSLITSSDWQSPSFAFSLYGNAGRQTGKITGTINDYKRDVHLDEYDFEQKFLREFVDVKFKITLKAYLVNSGQAAFQTILTYLLANGNLNGKIMVGAASYFQYKQILSGTFSKNIIYFDETNPREFAELFYKNKPAAIFIDSLCNNRELTKPELKKLMEQIYENAKRETYIVIDNTCSAFFSQPFTYRGRNSKVRLITFESLNKYYQYGMDRVTAGIIICENRDAGGIFEYRKHSGTNINDSSVFALPKPNRHFLTKRMTRIKRNSGEIASFIDKYLKIRANSKTERVIQDKDGCFFNIILKNKYDKPKAMNKFLNIVIKNALSEKVNIVAGTSFGLNSTRVYLTALYSKFGKPFLRVSAGTEDSGVVEKIKRVFLKTIKEF